MSKIQTTLHYLDHEALTRFMENAHAGEIISLGIDHRRGFIITTPEDGSSLRAVEKRTLVTRPDAIAHAPILLEGVQQFGDTTLVVTTAACNPDDVLLHELVEACVSVVMRSKTPHLVLATWQTPSPFIYLRRSSRGDFSPLTSNGRQAFRCPRLVSLTGDLTGMLVIRERDLCLITLAGEAGGAPALYSFGEEVIDTSRLQARSDGQYQFMVTTERGIHWMLFDPSERHIRSLHESYGISFGCLGMALGSRRPLALAHESDTGELYIGPPAPNFVPSRLADLMS